MRTRERASMGLIFTMIMVFSGYVTNIEAGMVAGATVKAGLGGAAWETRGSGNRKIAGLIAGSLFGFVLDEQDRKVIEQSSPRTIDRIDRKDPLTINDVIKLSQAGISDDTIIQYIHEKRTPYTLTQTQIRRLLDAGVSGRVIQSMTDTDKL